jgi:hypothetical protein
MRYWIKLYTEITRDPKMGRLTDRQFRTCINLFAVAGETDDGGRLPPLPDMTWLLRLTDEQLAEDLAALTRVGILEERAGEWYVRKWAERQAKPPSDQRERVRERVTEHRKRQRNESVTTLQPGVTTPETETETDVDIETEKETERETDADVAWKQAVRAFESSISLVSGSLVPDMLDMWSVLQSGGHEDWWEQAITVAVARNKRSWSYVRGVLEGCLREGHPPRAATNGTSKKAAPTGPERVILDGKIWERRDGQMVKVGDA